MYVNLSLAHLVNCCYLRLSQILRRIAHRLPPVQLWKQVIECKLRLVDMTMERLL